MAEKLPLPSEKCFFFYFQSCRVSIKLIYFHNFKLRDKLTDLIVVGIKEFFHAAAEICIWID